MKSIFLANKDIEWSHIYGFVFCATLFIYAGHRVIGLKKSEAFTDKGRYKVISEYKNHIIIYALLGFLGTLIFTLFLSWFTIFIMLLPGFISIGYIVPMFSGKEKKRLRDFNFIKIFFVALVWTWVTVVLPWIELGGLSWSYWILSMLEVFLFVFSITIPFDIRDLNVDGFNDVKTIPSTYGIPFSRKLALFSLVVSFGFAIVNLIIHSGDNFNWILLISFIIGYFLTGLLIWNSTLEKEDYYYTFLLDGTMIFVPVLIILNSLY